MEPEEELTYQEICESFIRQIKALRVEIDGCINDAGRIADFLSGYDGTRTVGVHGLQMAYDRLTEAKMWAGISLGELGHMLPQEFRDEASTKVGKRSWDYGIV